MESESVCSDAEDEGEDDKLVSTKAAAQCFKNRSAMRTCVAYELPLSQRFFLLLRGSCSLISLREKSRNPLGPGYLRADCLHIIGILYIFLYVDSVPKKIDSRTRLVQV